MTVRFTSAQFVGREHELARLAVALDQASGGRSTTLLIGGSGGLGASRLLTETERRLASLPGSFTVIRGRPTAAQAADPYAPIVPKKRNLPHLVGVATTNEIETRRGATLQDGTRIDAQSVEALSCSAQLLRLLLDEHGAIRSYQLMPASVTDALFGAIAARDQHCRWPGCRRKAIHTDVHHVIPQNRSGPVL